MKKGHWRNLALNVGRFIFIHFPVIFPNGLWKTSLKGSKHWATNVVRRDSRDDWPSRSSNLHGGAAPIEMDPKPLRDINSESTIYTAQLESSAQVELENLLYDWDWDWTCLRNPSLNQDCFPSLASRKKPPEICAFPAEIYRRCACLTEAAVQAVQAAISERLTQDLMDSLFPMRLMSPSKNGLKLYKL